jgi:NADH:ubiquinone oxidoreductase subunit E
MKDDAMTPAPEVLEKKTQEEVLSGILRQYARNGESLLAILQDVQTGFRYIPEGLLARVAEWTEVPLPRVYAVATFYNAFSLERKGTFVIKVCMGTACHVRGAPGIAEELESLLGIKRGETTKDGRFTLETVNCVGACAIGPVAVVNDHYHGNLTRNEIKGILKNYYK